VAASPITPGGSSSTVGGAPVTGTGLGGSTSSLANPLAALAQLLGLSDPSNSNTGPGSTKYRVCGDN